MRQDIEPEGTEMSERLKHLSILNFVLLCIYKVNLLHIAKVSVKLDNTRGLEWMVSE